MNRDPAAPVHNWQPPPLPPRTEIEGRYVRLEPLAASHASELYAAYQGNDDVWTYMYCGPFPSEESYKGWLSTALADTETVFFALRDLASARALGVASYLRINPAAGSIELGNIALAPELQRSRAATEAWFLMMDWAFSTGYRRFEWKCNALNLASRRAAERLGLSYEGTFRQAAVVKGHNRDTAWFAAIDDEWPALRDCFQHWLSPQNFGPDGRQRESLSTLTRPILATEDPMRGRV